MTFLCEYPAVSAAGHQRKHCRGFALLACPEQRVWQSLWSCPGLGVQKIAVRELWAASCAQHLLALQSQRFQITLLGMNTASCQRQLSVKAYLVVLHVVLMLEVTFSGRVTAA